MSKVKIQILVLGGLLPLTNIKSIKSLKSELFEIIGDIQTYPLDTKADLDGFIYSDSLLSKLFPAKSKEVDIQIAITTVSLEENYYLRGLDNNKIVITYYEIDDYLKQENIPPINLIKYLLYYCSLVFKTYDNKLPQYSDVVEELLHDDTKGCLFDMHGRKFDVVVGCTKPIVCDFCYAELQKKKISKELLNLIRQELTGIKKSYYSRFTDFLKKHPLAVIGFSALISLFLHKILK